jgi:hypothetical protein
MFHKAILVFNIFNFNIFNFIYVSHHHFLQVWDFLFMIIVLTRRSSLDLGLGGVHNLMIYVI